MKSAAVTKSIRKATIAAEGAGVPTIAIRVFGGLGDCIVVARFVRDLTRVCEPVTFDIYAQNPTLASWVFGGIVGFNNVFVDSLYDSLAPRYDFGLLLSHLATVEPVPKEWRKLEQFSVLVSILRRLIEHRRSLFRSIDDGPQLENTLARVAVACNRTRRDYLHFTAGIPYGGDRLGVLTSGSAQAIARLAGRHYVTVNNGFDPRFVISGRRATKCYPYFPEVVALLKQRVPELLVVQLGSAGTSEPIPAADLVLTGGTSLAEAGAILAGAMLHLDNEGGLVHLASALGVRSCVVFGPTPWDYFGYPANINLAPPFCGGCWYTRETWMDLCPRDFAVARCLTEQPPQAVVEAAVRALGAKTPSLGQTRDESQHFLSGAGAPRQR